MGVLRFLRAHIDTLVAIVLAMAFLAEVYLAAGAVAGEPLMAGVEPDESVVLATWLAFLLSLAMRTRLPLVPLGLGLGGLALAGRADAELYVSLMAGLLLAAYSVGAWGGGRVGQIGALAVGVMASLVVVRSFDGTIDPDAHAVPALSLVVAWLLGLAVRSIRAARGDERVAAELDWEAGVAAPDFGRP